MDFKPPKGWETRSDTLYVNAAGVRIECRVYREKEGWFLIPAELSQEVIGFEPTPEGRDQAFAAFASGVLVKPGKKKAPSKSAAKPKKGRKPKEDSEEETEKESDEDSDESTGAKDSKEGDEGEEP